MVNLRVVDGKTRTALKDASAGYWGMPADKLISLLRTTPNGLTRSQAARRLKVSGPNSLEINPSLNFLGLLARQFTSPLILILLFAAAVSLFVGEWTDAAVIAAIVAGSGLISFAQEYSAGTRSTSCANDSHIAQPFFATGTLTRWRRVRLCPVM